jgi:hypothetical protein
MATVRWANANRDGNAMGDQMIDIYRCADRVEAETIRIRLAAAGIAAFVSGDDAVTSMAVNGGGVNTAIVVVEVANDDYEHATRILAEDSRRRLTLGPWTCDQCSENNDSAFDLCWNCGNERPDVDHAP